MFDGFQWAGLLDLYVANWSCLPRCARSSGVTGQPDSLYHNNGDGTFDIVTGLLGSETYGGGFVARWLDYDNDGDQLLLVRRPKSCVRPSTAIGIRKSR